MGIFDNFRRVAWPLAAGMLAAILVITSYGADGVPGGTGYDADLSSRPQANTCEPTHTHPGNRFTPAMDQNGFSADPMQTSLIKADERSALTSPGQPGVGRTAAR